MTVVDSHAGLASALALVNTCVVDADDSLVDGGALPFGDLDLLIVARRRDLLGDSLIAEGSCGQCAAAIDVRFSLSAYADHHRPRPPRGATAGEKGWWELSRHGIGVRVPSLADVLAASSASDPRAELVARCVRGTLTPSALRAAER